MNLCFARIKTEVRDGWTDVVCAKEADEADGKEGEVVWVTEETENALP